MPEVLPHELKHRLTLRERLWAAVPTTGLSLANKCLLLFGGAVVLIVTLALVLPLLRMNGLVERGQFELSRQMVQGWIESGGLTMPAGVTHRLAGIDARLVPLTPGEPIGPAPTAAPAESPTPAIVDPLAGDEGTDLDQARRALTPPQIRLLESIRRWLEARPSQGDRQVVHRAAGVRTYLYARAVREADERPNPAPPAAGGGGGDLVGLVVLERQASGQGTAGQTLLENILYLFAAGVWVLLLALLVFWFVTNRIILSPVRRLRDTAERVREGDLSFRSDIETNDEFEELAQTFNAMLDDLEQTTQQQRAVNAALDMKVSELAQANVLLFESAKMKGEFVANVSHELRTPLNSIIGFAELLLDVVKQDVRAAEQQATEQGGPLVSPVLLRRQRYIENILTAGRNLLSLIEDLLEMAKIEAGKVEVRPEAVNLRDVCEALVGLIQPLADRKGIRVEMELGPDLPIITTDPKRLHQVIFNFLSNAVKFTPARVEGGSGPRVIVRAERLPPSADAGDRVRVSVIDQGPGIPRDEQGRIFEKFHQVQRGENKQPGTGLGLSICKELSQILQGEIQLVSDVGVGSMFSIILPVHFDKTRLAETSMERRFRAALTGKGGF